MNGKLSDHIPNLRYARIVVMALAILAGTAHANAATATSCEVYTISASNSGEGIDPKLAEFAPLFKQSPFDTFNTFKLVSAKTYDLELKVPTKLKLPESIGGFLRLDSVEDGKLNLTLTLVRDGKKPIDIKGKASQGAPFFAAGLTKEDGVWIFGVKCKDSVTVTH